MKVIRLSKKAFNDLELLDIPREILNTEGKVYNFNYRNNLKDFKQLYHQQGLIFASKLYRGLSENPLIGIFIII